MRIGLAIPCYVHHIPNLIKLLDSIESQTVLPDHVVVSCSSTKELSLRKYPFRMDVITTEERKNAAQNRNIATRHLDTDIISYMDADDLMHPQRLEFIKYVFENTECEIALHNYSVSEDYTIYPEIQYDYGKLARAPSGCAVYTEDYRKMIHHAHSSIKKEIFDKVQYRENDDFAKNEYHGGKEDALFCGDILTFAKNVYIPLSLSFYFETGQIF